MLQRFVLKALRNNILLSVTTNDRNLFSTIGRIFFHVLRFFVLFFSKAAAILQFVWQKIYSGYQKVMELNKYHSYIVCQMKTHCCCWKRKSDFNNGCKLKDSGECFAKISRKRKIVFNSLKSILSFFKSFTSISYIFTTLPHNQSQY